MADPQDIQNQQALNNELEETRDLANEVRNSFRGIGAELSEAIARGMENLNGSARNVAETIRKDLNRSIEKQKIYTNDIKNLESNRRNESLKLSKIESLISRTKQQQLNIEDYLLEAVAEGLITEEERKQKIEEINQRYKEQQGILKTLSKEAEKQERALGITYKIFDGISKIPILGTLMNVSKVKKKMEDAADDGKSAWSVFGTGVKETFSQIGKSLTDPLTIITGIASIFGTILKSVLEIDKRNTDFAKTLGVSKEGAQVLANNFNTMSYSVGQYSKNLTAGTFSIKSQIQATNELNDALGTSTLFTGEMVAGQVLLTKRLGLSGEEASEFAKFSLLSGKSQEKITAEIGNQIVAFRNETGVQLNMKKVMQDVSKIQGQLSANLGNDPKKIAAAVMQAQKLGITLEQTRKISESLLDFQGSIEAELEAELLTGKQLNFERARALALQGKTAEAAKELLDQVGGLDEFQKLNVIQQNTIAKSVGMTADEMADAFKQQELLKGTAFQTKEAFLEQRKIAEQNGTLAQFEASVKQAANGEQLLAMGAQQSAQEKFQESIDKLKETLSNIVSGPLLGIVDKFANFISDAENLKSIFKAVEKILDTIAIIIGVRMVAGLAKAVIQLGIAAVEAGIMGAGAATAASAITFGAGAIAIVAALSSIMGAFDGISNGLEAKKVGDAAISPSGGLLISGPKGSFITDPADQVVAAPNAANLLGGGSGITKADIDAIANRPIAVNVQANTDTILRLNTVQSQYAAPNSFA